MNRSCLALLATVVLVAPAVADAKIQSAFGITINSCVVNNNGSGQTNGINIVYYNTHQSPATEVDFLVKYHGKKTVFMDRGSFAVNAQINHNLTNGLVGSTWNGPKPTTCTVQRVLLESGESFGQ